MPCWNVGRANQIIDREILHNPLYDIRTTHTSLLVASIIYGVRIAIIIEEDCSRIEEVPAAISAAVRIHTVRLHGEQAIAQYAHNCIPLCHNILFRVTRPFRPALAPEGSGNETMGMCVGIDSGPSVVLELKWKTIKLKKIQW